MIEQEKQRAAKASLQYIKHGMTVGLGSGSTAEYLVQYLAEKVEEENLSIKCVSSSNKTARMAQKLGLTVIEISKTDTIDVNIDSADEFDPQLQLIKGGGGALLREKIVAQYSEKNIVIVDSSKQVEKLGQFPLPIEVIPFAASKVKRLLESWGISLTIRTNEEIPFRTDEGNWIFDLDRKDEIDFKALQDKLINIVGVVETGLFLTTTDVVIMAKDEEVKTFIRK